MNRKNKLGKGLGALLDNQNINNKQKPSDIFFGGDNAYDKTESAKQKNIKKRGNNINNVKKMDAEYLEIDVKNIIPNKKQPRVEFSKKELLELSDSIKNVGLLQPIIVRNVKGQNNKYEIVMGERRFRAVKLANQKKIPAIIKTTNDDDMLRDALLENLHRVQLNPIEEAASYKQMISDFNAKHLEIAKKLSKSRAYITNTIRLLNLPTETQKLLLNGDITYGHARALLQLKNKKEINYLANKVVKENISVRNTEHLASLKSISEIDKELKNVKVFKQNVKIKKGEKGEKIIELENQLSDKLNTVVNINIGLKKGNIKIDFASFEDLNRIISILK